MSGAHHRFGRGLAWAWRRASAAVALALIVGAAALGYWLGRGGAAPSELAHAEPDSAAPVWYTCSMHPSVRLQDPNAKCPICFMDLIPVSSNDTGADDGATRLSISENAAALSRIETARVERRFPVAETRLYGRVTYDETSVARLTAYFPGRIDRLFVNYVGVPVARGDHLAEIFSPALLAAFEELRQAGAAAATEGDGSDLVRRATAETLVASREKLRLFGLTTEQIAAIEDDRFDADRLTIYAPIGGVVTHLAVREGDYVQTGAPIATVASLQRLWLDLEAYESQLPMLRWGQPVSFTVEAHPGEVFEGRVSFIEPIVDDRTRTAAVRVAVDNADRRLKPGMFASAVVRARVGENGAMADEEWAGLWVCPMHPTVVKDAPGSCDICGMDLVTTESLGVAPDPAPTQAPLVIPRSAALFTGARSVVYVQVEDMERPTYEGREVTLGARAGDLQIVRSGLVEGERVVVNGAFRIDSAMQIAAKPSMMSEEDAVAEPAAADLGAPEAFIAGLGAALHAYLTAQERLAADDFEGYLVAASALSVAVAAVDDSALQGESLAVWRRAAAALAPGDGGATIEDARAGFESMSAGAIELARRFGHADREALVVAHCPMAFGNRGADWLQRGETIDNPYFGSRMRRCGSVVETLAPSASARDGGHRHE